MFRRGIFATIVVISMLSILYLIRDALVPFLIATIVAYLTLPIVDFAHKHRISRGVASALVVFILAVIFACLVGLVIPMLFSKVADFVKVGLDASSDGLRESVVSFLDNHFHFLLGKTSYIVDKAFVAIVSNLGKLMDNVMNQLWLSSAKVINFATVVFVCPLVTFYLLRDWHNVSSMMVKMLPLRYRADYLSIISDINKNLSNFLHGQMRVSLFLSLFYASALAIAGLNFGIILGLLIGFVSFVPYIGFLAGFITAAVMALVQFSESYRVIIVISILVFGQILEGNFITPRIIGRSVGLHPNWLVFGLFVSMVACGFIGIIFALPMTAITAVVVRFVIAKYRRSRYYLE